MFLHKRLFFFLLILLPTQLGYHFWPSWSIVLGRKIDYLSPTLYVTDILIVCILILSKTFSVRIIPLLLFAVVNILFATNRPVAIYAWIKAIEYVLLVVYIVRNKPSKDILLLGLAIGVMYSSLLAIAQFILQHAVGSIFWWLGERTFSVTTPGISRLSWCIFQCKELLRAYATFSHPNVLGGYLAVVLPIIIQYANNPIIKLSNVKKLLYFFVIIFGYIALVFTFSRSAWIVGIFGIGITLLRYKKLFPIIFSILFISWSMISFPASTDESVVRRVELNQAALTMWLHSPFVGIGLGNFVIRLPDTDVSRQGNFLQPVHNIYLLILSEIGIIGVIAVIGVIWVIRKKISLHMPFLMLLFLGLVDHYPLTLQQGQLLFTILAALMLQ